MDFNEAIYVTEKGLQKIKDDLNYLITVKRVEVAERLEIAISHGDLSENADYDYAKQEQALVEGRIQDLQDALRRAEVIETEDIAGDCVGVGATVTIVEEGDEPETYRIVGVHEANPSQGMISNKSPLGSALLGARVGDVVIAQTPGGNMSVQIQAIA